MTTEHTIRARARRADGRMDVADLREFLAGIPQTAHANNRVLKVRTTLRGAIKSVSITLKEERTAAGTEVQER